MFVRNDSRLVISTEGRNLIEKPNFLPQFKKTIPKDNSIS